MRRVMMVTGLMFLGGAWQLSAQTAHLVRMIADPANDAYRFEPAVTAVQPNDVIVFRVVSGALHSVVFEAEGLPPGVRGALNTALSGRAGDLSSPLLTAAGGDYRVTIPRIPPGKYGFYCLPHRAYDMRGVMVVR